MFGKLLIVAVVASLAWGALARTSDGSGGTQIYLVKSGDTLWSIAVRHYGGDPRDAVYELERRNHLGAATLRPGERLILP